MLRTVKVKKKLRLDELIKYVWDNDFSARGYMCFRSDCDNFEVRVSTHKLDYVWDNTSKFSGVPRHTTFTVEVEEEIDYDTVFEEVYRVTKEGDVTSDKNKSINECLDWKDYQTQIFVMIDRKLELIWEAE